MAGRPKLRAKLEAEAKEAGLSYEAYKAKVEAEKQDERDRILDEKEKRLEAKHLREKVRLKRSELSEWMVSFVSSNMRKHGQAIFESLLADDPKAAASFLSQMMKFAAPTVADPEKDAKNGGGEQQRMAPEYEQAAKKIDQLKKQFNKE